MQLFFRNLLVSCLLVLLALFVALPTTPANTLIIKGSRVWHISKASNACEIGIEGAEEVPVTERHVELPEPRLESASVFAPEALLPTLVQLRCTYHFRPPPLS